MATSGVSRDSRDDIGVFAPDPVNDDIDMPAQELKRQRGYVKANITRRCTYIRKLMSERKNVAEVKTKLLILEEIIQEFGSVHTVYHEGLTETEEIEESKSYHDVVMHEIELFICEVRQWCVVASTLEDAAKQLNVDNVSAGSWRSNTSVRSERAKLAARTAALRVEAASLQAQGELESQELLLQQRKRELKIKLELEKTSAEDQVYQEFDVTSQCALSVKTEKQTFEYINAWRAAANEDISVTSVNAIKVPNNQMIIQADVHQTENTHQSAPGVKNDLHLEDSNFAKMMEQQRNLLSITQLPKLEIMTFDGDPLKYWPFIRSFENAVDSQPVDNSAKLSRLIQYCTGKASKVISCCLMMNAATGYNKAKCLLKERFGNDFVIAEAYIKRVTQGNQLKASDRVTLLDFSDELGNCYETLSAVKKLSELNNQHSLVLIAKRLPLYLQNRWKKTAYELTKKNGKSDISDLVKFVNEAAAEANDPVFGNLTEVITPNLVRRPVQRSVRSFTTETVNTVITRKSCPLCGADHALYGCERFKKMRLTDRYKVVFEKRLCNNCLQPGHIASRCLRDSNCLVRDCGKKHSTYLHPQTPSGAPAAAVANYTTRKTNSSAKVALPVVPVIIKSPSSSQIIETYALLDNGSTNTFCSEDLLRQLNINQTSNETLSLTTLERENSFIECKMAMNLHVSDINGENTVNIPRVYTRELPMFNNLVDETILAKWKHLQGIPLVNQGETKVTLLIGQDVPEALVPIDVRRGKPGEPYATKTILGWTLNGPISMLNNHKAVVTFVHASQILESKVERFWELEASELLIDDKLHMSVNDKNVLHMWNNSITTEDGHYQLPIPFKQQPPNMPDNRTVAVNRLNSLRKRLLRDDKLSRRYQDGVQDLLDHGYAQKVPKEEINASDGSLWYLPHHPVFNENKPDKLRIVFDCSSKFMGSSLNDQVHKGPDLLNNIIGVLLKFRQESIAITADIEGMFHQVKVHPNDCDALRFLWYPDGDLNQDPVEYRMVVHLFGGIWSPSCANFALQRTALDNQMDFDSNIVNTVLNNFYMDDCLKSVRHEEEAIMLANQLYELLHRGGFHLTKFMSNNKNVLSSIPEAERAKTVKNLDQLDSLPTERALGICWDVETDQFQCKTKVKDKPLTKRGLLSIISSVYDPFGFVSPFVLLGKRILQQICHLKIGWDDALPQSQSNQWISWLDDLPKLKQFKVERCIQLHNSGDVQSELHHFADASQSGYGVVSYLRQVDQKHNVKCSFVMSKSRLAPLKVVTVPRLELSAATLAVKMDRLIQQELEIPLCKSIFWTDSVLVLQYINNTDKRFKTFVANRVATIHGSSSPQQWHHVSGEINPADDVSRGLSATKLLHKKQWLCGPDYLWCDHNKWPITPDNAHHMDLVPRDEVKKDVQVYSTSITQPDVLQQLFSRYSSWYKLKKCVAWLLRLKKILQDKIRKSGHADQVHHTSLTTQELLSAEIAIVKYVQIHSFKDERHLRSLNPIKLDDGVIRVGGRLKHASLATETKHPMILPKQHVVCDLIIQHYHEVAGHSGREHVLALLRQKFWIVKCRRIISNVLNKCRHCRKRYSSAGVQLMSQLPQDRVTPDYPPFSFVGVDYFGPFYVQRGRSTVKRYGCLFTCLASKAVHIEVSHSLSTDSFINALQRLISRRGKMIILRSDNGTNFVGAKGELEHSIQDWNQSKISAFLKQQEITWKFNPPYASHMGGIWERQIRSIRRILMALTQQQVLDDESLTTLMCQIEAIINSRPITVVSSDPTDQEPLTPNHLLLLRAGPTVPPGVFVKEDLYHRRRWRQVQYLADVFWRRWTKEYLPSLQRRQKWLKPKRNFAVGDVVLLIDALTPRNLWPLGRITATFPGKDGLVRSVQIKTRSSSFCRPIDKLCLLEAACV